MLTEKLPLGNWSYGRTAPEKAAINGQQGDGEVTSIIPPVHGHIINVNKWQIFTQIAVSKQKYNIK